jgi:hypothetical protein
MAKNLQGRVGVKIILKILLQICADDKRSQNFSEKFAFLAKKSKISLKMPFFF